MEIDAFTLANEVYRQARLLNVRPPGVTRLVKIIYLADLEWRRTHAGKPLAPLSWRFHHYGPYADELAEVTGGENAEIKELEGDRTVKVLSFSVEELSKSSVPEGVMSLLSRLVKEWGDADLNSLLNYVYFDTEPMENAERGKHLDFSDVRPRPVIKLRLDAKRLHKLRAQLKKRAEELSLDRGGIRQPAFDLNQHDDWDETPALLPAGAIVRLD